MRGWPAGSNVGGDVDPCRAVLNGRTHGAAFNNPSETKQ